MKRYRVINRFRFFTTISLLLLALFFSMFFMVVNALSTSNDVLVPVYVSEGDSLWKLSAQYSAEEMDIRDYINRVIEINKLDNVNIKPGQLLMFPQSTQ